MEFVCVTTNGSQQRRTTATNGNDDNNTNNNKNTNNKNNGKQHTNHATRLKSYHSKSTRHLQSKQKDLGVSLITC